VCLLSILVCWYASFMDHKDFISKTSLGTKPPFVSTLFETCVCLLSGLARVQNSFQAKRSKEIWCGFGFKDSVSCCDSFQSCFNTYVRLRDGSEHRLIKTQNEGNNQNKQKELSGHK
jgi:hypothetical protein